MRINIVALLLLIGVISLTSGQYVRQKRGIGSWFSGMFSRFKKSSKKPVYHIYPAYGDYGQNHGHSFGPAPKPHGHHQYAAHHPHHVHSSGYGQSSYSNYGGHIGAQEHSIHKEIPYGFGPIKDDDVLGDLHSSGSYVPEAPHIVPDSYGAPQSHSAYAGPSSSYSAPASGGGHGGHGGSIVVDYSAPKVPNDPFASSANSLKAPQFAKEVHGKGSFVPPAPFLQGGGSNNNKYVASDDNDESSVVGYLPTFPDKESSNNVVHGKQEGKSATFGDAGQEYVYDVGSIDFLSAPASDSYKEPSSISVTNEAYKPPGNGAILPLAPHNNFGSARVQNFISTGSSSRGGSLKFQSSQGGSSGNGKFIDQVAAGAIQGYPQQSYFPQLGPHDPIIEIVFQDAEPQPSLPPPKLDPKLFLPATDDVEVYFIEYSSEDEIKDVNNIDVKNARPAILEDFPEEVPYELRNQLLRSGILENAQIEIINLDNAVHDRSLDPRTRNALVNAYNRRQRQTTSLNEIDSNQQAVDIRVKKLSHDSNTPEGVAEYLSGLKHFRQGTYAGIVKVNDTNSKKFIPVQVNGDRFPIPRNIQLENKQVNGVLVLAENEDDNAQFAHNHRQPKDLRISRSHLSKRIDSAPPKFQLDLKNHDNAGWIPMPTS